MIPFYIKPLDTSQSTPDPINYQDVYAIFGQSNIDGRNALPLPVGYENPTDKVKIQNNGAWIDWDCSKPPVMFTTVSQYAADTIFLQMMYAYKGEIQYAIKKSRGGTAFRESIGGNGDWNIDSIEAEDHYLPFRQRIVNTKNLIESNGDVMRVKFIWADIGETDSLVSDKATFKADFKNFILRIRQLIGDLRVPVVHRKLQLIQSGVTQWMLDAQEEFASGEINDYFLIRNTYTLQDAYHLDDASTLQYATDVFDLVKDW